MLRIGYVLNCPYSYPLILFGFTIQIERRDEIHKGKKPKKRRERTVKQIQMKDREQ